MPAKADGFWLQIELVVGESKRFEQSSQSSTRFRPEQWNVFRLLRVDWLSAIHVSWVPYPDIVDTIDQVQVYTTLNIISPTTSLCFLFLFGAGQ